jgi:hypothetical protein
MLENDINALIKERIHGFIHDMLSWPDTDEYIKTRILKRFFPVRFKTYYTIKDNNIIYSELMSMMEKINIIY